MARSILSNAVVILRPIKSIVDEALAEKDWSKIERLSSELEKTINDPVDIK